MARIGLGIGVQYSRVLASIDPQAQAFITAAGITDPTQITAINTLVVSLKSASLWDKMKALYPMIGGSATSHKFNLKDPRDLDAAFRLAFSGGWTHSSNGALPNGTNAYANTFWQTLSQLPDNNTGCMSYYSKTNNAGGRDIGSNAGGTGVFFSAIRAFGGGSFIYTESGGEGVPLVPATGNIFNIVSRVSSTQIFRCDDGTITVGGTTSSSKARHALDVYIGANNNSGAPAFFGSKLCAFAHLGIGISQGEAQTLNTIVQAFQTTLGRAN